MADMGTAEEEMKEKCVAYNLGKLGSGYVCGIRTYSIALIVILAFVVVCIRLNDIEKLFGAAMLVLGYLFGSKMPQQATK